MTKGDGITNGFPLPINVPPHPPVYQFTVEPLPRIPPKADNDIVAGPDPLQKTGVLELALAGATDDVLTMIMIETKLVVLQSPSALT